MAIKLIANYSKRLGLPNFSSHQFSVSVETELVTTDDIPGESARLYQLLQTNVDGQMQNTGFVPPDDYGIVPTNDNSAGFIRDPSSPNNGHSNLNGSNWQNGRAWKCSDKQKDLILKLVDEHNLEKTGVENLSKERFGKGVKALNKVEASGLIDELLETHGGGSTGQVNGRGRNGSAYNGTNGGRVRS
jgi:hypothetical protein